MNRRVVLNELACPRPQAPSVFNVTCRKTREPGKIYHMHDVGVEATCSAARANRDSAVFDGHKEDRRSECYNNHSAD